MLLFHYPKCSTCVKARKWLRDKNVEFTEKNIVEETPSVEELKKVLEYSGLTIKKLFNTSGMLYRELNIKEKMDTMSDDEKLKLLAENGMLIKRPIVLGDDFALVGFKESEWGNKWQ